MKGKGDEVCGLKISEMIVCRNIVQLLWRRSDAIVRICKGIEKLTIIHKRR
jgi:hypothetical protein